MATRKTTKPVRQTRKPVDTAVTVGKDTVEKVVKAGTESATRTYEQAVALTQDQVEKASSAAFKGYDELVGLNKENLDAVMKSGAVVAKGYEALGQEFLAFTQSSIEANVAQTQALFRAKTLREFIDLQTDYARKSFDTAVNETAILSELSVKTANEALQPIQSRVNVAVQTVLKPVAA